MELKHTPGPWSLADKADRDDRTVVLDCDHNPLAHVDGDTAAQQLHDARLVSAAPELLTELIASARRRLGKHSPESYCLIASMLDREVLSKQLTVIAKARGKSAFGNDWMEALS